MVFINKNAIIQTQPDKKKDQQGIIVSEEDNHVEPAFKYVPVWDSQMGVVHRTKGCFLSY